MGHKPNTQFEHELAQLLRLEMGHYVLMKTKYSYTFPKQLLEC